MDSHSLIMSYISLTIGTLQYRAVHTVCLLLLSPNWMSQSKVSKDIPYYMKI